LESYDLPFDSDISDVQNGAVEWWQQLGKDFQARREQKGWTQLELADRATALRGTAETKQLSTDTVHRVEYGKNPTVNTIEELARALGVRITIAVSPLDDVCDADHDPAAALERAHPVLTSEPPGIVTPARADAVLLPPITANPRHGEETLASARDEIERILADLTAVAEKLPRRQTAVDRRGGSRGAPGHRRPREPSDRQAAKKKRPRKRPPR
jgi:transcriptional regulator with XRE-family HTH domain